MRSAKNDVGRNEDHKFRWIRPEKRKRTTDSVIVGAERLEGIVVKAFRNRHVTIPQKDRKDIRDSVERSARNLQIMGCKKR